MAFNIPPIPNDPLQENHLWRQWFTLLRDNLVGASSGSVPINHNALSTIQGGSVTERYHLTSAQTTGLTAGVQTALHKHDHATQDNLNSATYSHVTANELASVQADLWAFAAAQG